MVFNDLLIPSQLSYSIKKELIEKLGKVSFFVYCVPYKSACEAIGVRSPMVLERQGERFLGVVLQG